jgi:biopolymer transport protein TolR
MAQIATRSRSKRRTMNEINMVPFIDVMLVLLIIFMVTAPLISTSVIDVPSVGKAATAPEQIIRIELKSDHKIYLQSFATSAGQSLKSTLNSASQSSEQAQEVDVSEVVAKTLAMQQSSANADNTPVIIFGDKSLAYAEVIKILDLLQRAGVQKVGLSVQLAQD